jgi:alanine dehydrogenase
MMIGLPKETKNGEHRVALTPQGVAALCAQGQQVIVEQSAGCDSGFTDDDYLQAGAKIADAAAAWACAMVVKVKEPQAAEYDYLHHGMVLFTYLHLAAEPVLQKELQQRGVCALAYETLQLSDGSLPLLAPMSRIAGRIAVSLGMHWLMKENGTPYPGMGRIAGGIPDVPAIQVLILGGGNVGVHAAQVAIGMGADVVIVEARAERAQQLRTMFPHQTVIAGDAMLDYLAGTALLIGAALVPGTHAPRLLTREDLTRMPTASVLVDVAIDQGGISETSRPTSYSDPVYMAEGVLHGCLPNLPACVPQSATQALTSATLPYIITLATQGVKEACRQHPELSSAIAICDGKLIHPALKP